jgi:hypothetical protein
MPNLIDEALKAAQFDGPRALIACVRVTRLQLILAGEIEAEPDEELPAWASELVEQLDEKGPLAAGPPTVMH